MVHLGPRAQASVVLTCPGVGVEALASWVDGPPPAASWSGFESELAAVEHELAELSVRGKEDAERGWARACRRVGLAPTVEGLAELRAEVGDLPIEATDDSLELVDLPSEDDGLEHLPLFFDAAHGRVALSGLERGVELLAIAPEGGIARHLASYARPTRLPRLTGDGRALLRGYLRYVLDRDVFVGAALRAAMDDPEIPLLGHLAADLVDVEVAVLTRAVWRAQLSGLEAGELSAAEVAAGIRATDMDYLDRPTAGRVL